MAASTIPPHSVWPCGTPFGNTQAHARLPAREQEENRTPGWGPSEEEETCLWWRSWGRSRPGGGAGHSEEGPNRLRSAPITDPLSRGFGIPNRSPDPLVQRAGRDHPFQDETRVTSQGKKLRGSMSGDTEDAYHQSPAHEVSRSRTVRACASTVTG